MNKIINQKIADALGEFHILSVGVSDYADGSGFGKLKVCTEDARRVAECFAEVKYLNANPNQIRLLSSSKDALQRPTAGHLFTALHHLADNATKDDRVLFFFSGHGAKEGDELYLVPEDGNNHHKKYLLPFKEVMDIINASAAKVKVIVLDACSSGPSVSTIKGALTEVSPKFLANYIEKTKGAAIIASSTSEQSSTTQSPDPKVSLFTHFFVNALRGAHGAMTGKLLTLASAYEYVSINVVKTSKSYGNIQQPTIKLGMTGSIVLGDFSAPLLSAAANDLVPAVDVLSFQDSRKGDADEVLTSLKYYSQHQPAYIERRVNEELPSAYRSEFGEIRAKLFDVFNAGEVKINENGVEFPGGSYSVSYAAKDVKHGFYISVARFDADWLTRTDQMLSLLKLLGLTNPDLIEFETSHKLDPEACIPKFQAAGWKITNAQTDEVEAQLNGLVLTVRPDSIRLAGFTPPELFGSDNERDETASLVTGLVRQIAGQ